MAFTIDSVQSEDVVLEQVDVDWRIPTKEKIDKFRKDDSFDYSKNPDPRSLFERLMDWLATFMPEKDYRIDSSFWIAVFNVLKYIGIALIITLIVYFVMRLFGVDLRTVLGKKKTKELIEDIDIQSEDINEMSFQKLIADAISAKDYRLAIRYAYLYSLKQMSDKDIIYWSPTRTNLSYLQDIKSVSLRTDFLKITYLFDYVWYGEKTLNDEEFEIAHNQFDKFNKVVNNE